MGSPDLPGNGDDRRRQFQPPPSNELPMHGQLDLGEVDAGELDQQVTIEPAQQNGGGAGETIANSAGHNPYVADGYHPLNFEPTAFGDDDDDDEDDDEDEEETSDDDEERTNAATNDQLPANAPEPEEEAPINRIDRDLLRQVWSQPRPAELDIEIDVEQIKSVMASVTLNLGNIEAPAWASAVSGAELLAQIRHPAAAARAAAPATDGLASKPPSG